MSEGAVCKPNISARGRRLRRRIGYVAIGLALGVAALTIGLHAPWFLRALVFIPAAGAAVTLLQVRRNTCVARAKEGTFEHDDMSKTAAAEDEVAASRRVAATIQRDGLLIGAASAAVAAATVFLT